MAWNEPGGNGSGNGNKDDDPWGPRKKKDGPPDLDEVFKNFKKKLSSWFGGGKKGGGGSSNGKDGGESSIGATGIIVLVVVIALIWAGTGFYTVKLGERGVVQRFGVVTTLTKEGLHWHLPSPIEKVTIKNIDRNRTITIDQAMLTKDEKLVSIKLTVNYSILDINKYLFEIRNPEQTLREALESSLREALSSLILEDVMGKQQVASHQNSSSVSQCRIGNVSVTANLNFAPVNSELVKGKKGKKGDKDKTVKVVVKSSTQRSIDEQVEIGLKRLIKKYKTGITISSILFEKPTAPDPTVEQAFRAVTSAQEEATRLQEKAWEYCQVNINEALGKQAITIKSAEAYKIEKKLLAQGQAAGFLKILREYEKSPVVAHKRMYLESQAKILKRTPKVYINTKSSGNVLFLPLDKMLKSMNTTSDSNK